MVSKDKAYIVVNEQQECEVLDKLEEKGALWGTGKMLLTLFHFVHFRMLFIATEINIFLGTTQVTQMLIR